MGVGGVTIKELGNRSRRGSERNWTGKTEGVNRRGSGSNRTWGYSLT
jgi:hypothetical protein